MTAIRTFTEADFNIETGFGPLLPAGLVTTGTIFTCTSTATNWNSSTLSLQRCQPQLSTGWNTIASNTANGTLKDTPANVLYLGVADTLVQYRFTLNWDQGEGQYGIAPLLPQGLSIAITQ